MTEPNEELRFLAGSRNRIEILRLLDSNAMDVRSLRDELDIPRTTLQKNIRELENKNWIQKTDADETGYTTTTQGNIVLTEYTRTLEILETATELEPFLRWVPRGALGPDVRALKDSTVMTPEPPNPRAPEKRLTELIDASDTIRVASPILTPMMVDELARSFNEGEIEGEIVVEPGVADVLRNDYPDLVERASQNPSITIKVYDGELPFVLFILDDRVVYAAFDENGMTRALLTNTSSASIRHAEKTYESYASEAEPLV